MRAIQVLRYGPPQEALQLREAPSPKPGPGQVRIRLSHRPINPSDLLLIRGMYPIRPNLPSTTGFEGVGRIDALGPDVQSFKLGERVVPLAPVAGTWAEQMIVSSTAVMRVPDTVIDQAAAQFLVNPVAAWAMVFGVLGLRSGDTLLQTAAGSTVGRLVIQICRLNGIRTVSLVRRQTQVKELESLGGDVVLSSESSNYVQRIMEATAGEGVDGVIDAVGGNITGELLSCLRPRHTLVTYGLLSGQSKTEVNLGEVLLKSLTLRGFWLRDWLYHTPQAEVQATLDNVMGLLAAAKLALPVAAEYDLGDFLQALQSAAAGRGGKVLLVG